MDAIVKKIAGLKKRMHQLEGQVHGKKVRIYRSKSVIYFLYGLGSR
jgi:hypothetical protein